MNISKPYYKHKDQKRGNYREYIDHPDTIGNLSRSHKLQRIASQVFSAEGNFMRVAFVENRRESQREERRRMR